MTNEQLHVIENIIKHKGYIPKGREEIFFVVDAGVVAVSPARRNYIIDVVEGALVYMMNYKMDTEEALADPEGYTQEELYKCILPTDIQALQSNMTVHLERKSSPKTPEVAIGCSVYLDSTSTKDFPIAPYNQLYIGIVHWDIGQPEQGDIKVIAVEQALQHLLGGTTPTHL